MPAARKIARTSIAPQMLAPTANVQLVPTTRADIHARSRGLIMMNPISRPIALRDGVLVPERGGFYCEALFGPLAAPAPDRFAHFDLPEPLPHPRWPDMAIETIAVIPAALRRLIPRGDVFELPPLTYFYQRLYEGVSKWRRLGELGAPASVVEPYRDGLGQDLAALYDNAFNPQPLVNQDRSRDEGLAGLLATRDPSVLEIALFALGLRIIST
jgi:hypothetical protein